MNDLPVPGSVCVVRGDCFDLAPSLVGQIDLVVADPPYGDILKHPWDVECYSRLGQLLSKILALGATAYVWGGIGRHRQRHMFRWLANVEDETDLRMWNLITWKKKRAYGKSNDYLFVREECAMLVKGDGPPKTFHVPLLEAKRGYAGYEQDVIVGYFDGCYHNLEDGFHEDSSGSCLSPGSQASSKRLVYELLRQTEVSFGSGVSQTASSGLVRKEPGPSPFVRTEMGKEEPIKVLGALRANARKREIPFALIETDLRAIWSKVCPVFGIKIFANDKRRNNSLSVDRIDNSVGYVPGNICIMSWRANKLKADASIEELEALVTFLKRQRLKT